MAASVNKVIIIGNLGKDPEIRDAGGKQIANMTIAVSETWKDRQTGEKREKTEWVRVVCFNDNLVKVIANYVKRGSRIYVEGSLQTRKWQDKDGQDRYVTEVVLQTYGGQIVLLDGPPPRDEQPAQRTTTLAPPTAQKRTPKYGEDDAVPF